MGDVRNVDDRALRFSAWATAEDVMIRKVPLSDLTAEQLARLADVVPRGATVNAVWVDATAVGDKIQTRIPVPATIDDMAAVLRSSPSTRRALSSITAEEWIRWSWVDVTQHDDPERMMVFTGLRTPDDAARELANVTAIGWDAYREGARRDA